MGKGKRPELQLESERAQNVSHLHSPGSVEGRASGGCTNFLEITWVIVWVIPIEKGFKGNGLILGWLLLVWSRVSLGQRIRRTVAKTVNNNLPLVTMWSP
jgi:hypothetical protein